MSSAHLTVSAPRHRRYSANDGYDYAKSSSRVKHVHFGGETIINPSRKRYTSSDSDFRASLSDSEPARLSSRQRHPRSSSSRDDRREGPAHHSHSRSSSRPAELPRHIDERSPSRRPSHSHGRRHDSSPAPPPQYYLLPPAHEPQRKRHNDSHQPKHSSRHHHDSEHRHRSPSRRIYREEGSLFSHRSQPPFTIRSPTGPDTKPLCPLRCEVSHATLNDKGKSRQKSGRIYPAPWAPRSPENAIYLRSRNVQTQSREDPSVQRRSTSSDPRKRRIDFEGTDTL
nr:hypothetical protein CFP56_64602 [Quercus suber]